MRLLLTPDPGSPSLPPYSWPGANGDNETFHWPVFTSLGLKWLEKVVANVNHNTLEDLKWFRPHPPTTMLAELFQSWPRDPYHWHLSELATGIRHLWTDNTSLDSSDRHSQNGAMKSGIWKQSWKNHETWWRYQQCLMIISSTVTWNQLQLASQLTRAPRSRAAPPCHGGMVWPCVFQCASPCGLYSNLR